MHLCKIKWTRRHFKFYLNFVQNLISTLNLHAKIAFFFFLGPYPQHMEVPKLGVKSELQLPAYTTAIAMPDLSCICALRCSSQQCQILNSLSEARDGSRILMDTSWVHYH